MGPAGYVLLFVEGQRWGPLVVCAEDTHSRVFLKAGRPRVAGRPMELSSQGPQLMLPTFQLPPQAVPLTRALYSRRGAPALLCLPRPCHPLGDGDVVPLSNLCACRHVYLVNLTRAGVVDGAREVGPGKHDTYLEAPVSDGDRTTCGDLRTLTELRCRC